MTETLGRKRTFSHYVTQTPKPKEMIDCIARLLKLLERYRGGVIVKGRHPIHKAVVDLEKMCMVKADKADKRQAQQMPRQVASAWYWMLWVSRINDKPEAVRLRDEFVLMLVKFRDFIDSGEYEKLYVEMKEQGRSVWGVPGLGVR